MPQNDIAQTYKSQQFRHENPIENDLNTVEFRAGDPVNLSTNPRRMWANLLDESLKYTVDGIKIIEVAKASHVAAESMVWVIANQNKFAVGDVFHTLGFYDPGDRGAGEYKVFATGGTEVWVTITGSVEVYGGYFKLGTNKKIALVVNGIADTRQMGAKADGIQLDTVALQHAMDNLSGALFFSPGTYKVSGSGDACLTLSRKLSLIGIDPDRTLIRADFIAAGTSILKVAMNFNHGFTDVRNWELKGLTLSQNGGGKHALWFQDGFQIYTSEISNCNLSAGPEANGGYSIYCFNNLAHCKIISNTISSSIYMKCFDSNLIEKNTFFGTRAAITFDCDFGVYNNTVEANTIVNRDGAVHIINGDVIRVLNNQIELATIYGPSMSPVSAMIWAQGVARAVKGLVIAQNNFGGGTNLNHLIYIDNCLKAVIETNQLIAVNIAEVLFTSNAKYNIFRWDNTTRTQVSNPRNDPFIRAVISDSGVANSGVLKAGSTLNRQNGWVGGDYYKDEYGHVYFEAPINAGSTAPGTLIGTLPEGYRPHYESNYPCGTSAGSGYITIRTNGQIVVGSIPSNADVRLSSFVAYQNNDIT